MRRRGGHGFAVLVSSLLASSVLLASLKLGGFIGWSWWSVTAPVYVQFALFCLLVVVCVCIDLFSGFNRNKEEEDDLFA